MNILVEKFKEVLFAVLPITCLVLFLHFTITPLETHLLVRFILGAVLIVIGLSIFLFGVDLGVSPIGNLMGKILAKSNRISIISTISLVLGFFISVAEPDLHILAGQVAYVTSNAISKSSIVLVVSVGIAVLMTLGLLRIVYNKPLHKVLTVIYLIIFGLALFTSSGFLAVSFDASGATTGAMTVPFILALALGVSSLKKGGTSSEEDSFGLVAIASGGAIIAVMLMSILTGTGKISGSLHPNLSPPASIMGPFFETLPVVAGEIALALSPLLVIFLLVQLTAHKVSKKTTTKIFKGLLYTLVGLVLFLTGVNAGFMDVGSLVGYNIASLNKPWIVVTVGFILGLVVILAEPAVYVLTNQIETVTSGYVNRKIVIVALSLGVGVAVALSMIRILIPEVQLWHYLLPGYLACLIMMYFVPRLFVGIAFDSGGVASGPMTATFVLAFTQGVAEQIEWANVLVDGFGVISMVALTPIIALQTVGLIFKYKSVKGGLETTHAK